MANWALYEFMIDFGGWFCMEGMKRCAGVMEMGIGKDGALFAGFSWTCMLLSLCWLYKWARKRLDGGLVLVRSFFYSSYDDSENVDGRSQGTAHRYTVARLKKCRLN